MNWELIWKFVLVTILTVFAAMSVLVTIFGARDIKRLLVQLDEQDRSTDTSKTAPERLPDDGRLK